ncbi:MAG: hypothetical protein FJX67_12115 [Alphaproteobacteria bacterium]|nr:hypothetical protein [Alphaproteobacteria bacterium]
MRDRPRWDRPRWDRPRWDRPQRDRPRWNGPRVCGSTGRTGGRRRQPSRHPSRSAVTTGICGGSGSRACRRSRSSPPRNPRPRSRRRMSGRGTR